MELRKCCNHTYLFTNGPPPDDTQALVRAWALRLDSARGAAGGPPRPGSTPVPRASAPPTPRRFQEDPLGALIAASGKLQLLDRLMTKLRQRRHRRAGFEVRAGRGDGRRPGRCGSRAGGGGVPGGGFRACPHALEPPRPHPNTPPPPPPTGCSSTPSSRARWTSWRTGSRCAAGGTGARGCGPAPPTPPWPRPHRPPLPRRPHPHPPLGYQRIDGAPPPAPRPPPLPLPPAPAAPHPNTHKTHTQNTHTHNTHAQHTRTRTPPRRRRCPASGASGALDLFNKHPDAFFCFLLSTRVSCACACVWRGLLKGRLLKRTRHFVAGSCPATPAA